MDSQELQDYLKKGIANHEEVLEAGKNAAQDMQSLVKAIVSNL